MKRFYFAVFIVITGFTGYAQSFGEYLGDDSDLYASTKQVNQFFRRFNNEESPAGKRYYPEDKQYRERESRRKYISILFDKENLSISKTLKNGFIDDVTRVGSEKYLDFHGGEWVAEVTALINFKQQRQEITFYLNLQEEDVGSKWVLGDVYFQPFSEMFASEKYGHEDVEPFLHPMSHELDFMNLVRIFPDYERIDLYASRNHQEDHMTLFLYEVKQGNIKFVSVSDLQFHFFQVEGWYFSISEFNRKGHNSGWLISDLTQINQGEKHVLQNHIFKK